MSDKEMMLRAESENKARIIIANRHRKRGVGVTGHLRSQPVPVSGRASALLSGALAPNPASAQLGRTASRAREHGHRCIRQECAP